MGDGGFSNINWDEIDENTNPFGLGAAFGGTKLASSPPANSGLPDFSNDKSADRTLPTSSTVPAPEANNSGTLELSSPIRAAVEPVELSKDFSADGTTEARSVRLKTKGPRPVPPPRTVPAANSGCTGNEPVLGGSDHKADDQNLDVANMPPENFASDGEPADPHFTQAGSSRRLSNSSAATFDLASGNRSPLPEAEPGVSLSVDDELVSLRADKEHLTTIVTDMQRCIAEYERSLRQLAEEKARAEEAAKESVVDIISERDQAIEEISTIEKAFGDLHRRFEKSKQIIEGFKANEEALKKTAEEYQNQLKRQEQKYQALKLHAEQQLMKVAEETERAKRSNEDELTGLRATIKRSELRIRSLESQLEQKVTVMPLFSLLVVFATRSNDWAI
uniref:TACC_C domain-containing protein n=1 Tax=Mesocestoides corti TaxID=53468 RepID=A0A5K3F1P5_MESCO